MVFFFELLDIYQFFQVFFKWSQLFFWLFKDLIRWINIVLEFSLKMIFRRWMLIVDGKQFILVGSWWKTYQCIMVFLLELYQLFLFFSKLWSYGEILTWDFLRVITIFWICSGENMFAFSFRSSLICFRLSSCLSKSWSDSSCDTSSSLAAESITILCLVFKSGQSD